MRERRGDNDASLRNPVVKMKAPGNETTPETLPPTQHGESRAGRRGRILGRFPEAEPYRPSTCLLLKWKRTRDDSRS
jgi:hypothetical protein